MSRAVTTRLWMIRHAPVINPGGVIYGHVDLDCDCGNAVAVAAAADPLPDQAAWYVSPLKRTHQTAAALRAHRDARGRPSPDPVVDPGLIEQDFGDWAGMTYAELAAHDTAPDANRFWLAPAETRPPGGESFVELHERVSKAIGRLAAAHRGGEVVVVAHNGTIRSALGMALDLSPEDCLRLRIDTLSISQIALLEPGEDDPLAELRPGGDWQVGFVNRAASGS